MKPTNRIALNMPKTLAEIRQRRMDVEQMIVSERTTVIQKLHRHFYPILQTERARMDVYLRYAIRAVVMAEYGTKLFHILSEIIRFIRR